MIEQFITVLLINITMTSFACSCMNYIGVEEHISSTEIIFSGTVLKVEKRTIFEADQENSSEFQVYTIKVTSAYKGISESTIEIITGFGFGDCGEHFGIGYEYLIFAYDSEYTINKTNQFETNICKRNGLVVDKEAYLKSLKNLKPN